MLKCGELRFRSLTPKQKTFFSRLEAHSSSFREFIRGDEFYGRVVRIEDNGSRLSFCVNPIVGERMLREGVQTINVADRQGELLLTGLEIENCQWGENLIEIIASKPEDFCWDGTRGALLTTNGNSVDFSRKVRANYSSDSVLLYQAFGEKITNQALSRQKFGDQFKRDRMTWLKTSFFWMAYRSSWATKKGQTKILGIRISRSSFETLLNCACITNPTIGLYFDDLRMYARESSLHKNRIQWDPDREIDGRRIKRRTMQIGVSPDNLRVYLGGIVSIEDQGSLLEDFKRQRYSSLSCGTTMPLEFPYPTPEHLLKRFEMHQFYHEEDPRVFNGLIPKSFL